ncbi:MAG: elongation factor P [Chloroflexi bacterium]|nr:elongation factor P [Chloroflexota bacterium]
MISPGDLKKGITIELDGTPYQVLDYQHIKMGRGSAQIRLRLKDVKEGHIIERTFQASEKWPRARLDRRPVQFLYRDGESFHFMDQENYEQFELHESQVGDTSSYLVDGMTAEVLLYNDEPIGVELPLNVTLKVVETTPGFRGDTAQGGTKPATLETGLVVNVPLFVNEGDTIRVDTRDGSYIERV